MECDTQHNETEKWHSIQSAVYAECHVCCHYAEYRYAECRGTYLPAQDLNVPVPGE
jgi:hypothetical protein